MAAYSAVATACSNNVVLGNELFTRTTHSPASTSLARECTSWRQKEIVSPPFQCSSRLRTEGLKARPESGGFLTFCSPPSAPAAVTPLVDVYDFICNGPLLSKTGHTPDSVKESFDEWIELGLRLSRNLGFNELFLSPSEKIRIYHYYLPVFMWCKRQLTLHESQYKESEEIPALVIGITAPQGCGKSTLVYSLDYLFNSTGRRAISVSIDDFYLTGAEQEKLASENPGNTLLELRGNAGSHDLELGTQTLEALRNLSSEGRKVKVPRYDKVLLFEGWMLGFSPVGTETYEAVDPQLEKVNANLAPYHDAWDKYVDSWIVIKVHNLDAVYNWRLQAEIGMRLTGRPSMTDEEVKDFVSRYIPAYKAYLPGLYASGPKNAVPGRILQFDIDDDRNPIG
ncbi:hypothetical protein KP509_07G068000 [Ceratopteris richardii]|uniref:D-glycerate 3-kinase, chloroplastic n=1 Tax=Ceratopteris richardii TaxID=49495 RepID=A0A8T2UAW4_CERRI|nr:hypothetical protein KP509_07G068000 [Ceratopteris richardii]